MASYYQVRLALAFGALGVLQNTFAIEYSGAIAPADSGILTNMTTWMNRIYGNSSLRDYYADNITLKECVVTEHDVAGVLLRIVGGISPTVSGNSNVDSSALTTTMTGSGKTNQPKVRGSKRFPTPIDSVVVDGLLLNAAVGALAQATANWIAPGLGGVFPWYSGVFSEAVGHFVRFNGIGVVRNIPGTQVTRKPGRGL